MKKVLRRKVILQSVVIILALTLPSFAIAAQEGNEGYARVYRLYSHSTDGDSVGDVELTWNRRWVFHLENRQDGTGQPLVNPNLTIVTDLAFTGFVGDAWNQRMDPFLPNETAPSTYMWYWERNLEENLAIQIIGQEAGTTQFAPGFSVSRTVIPSTITSRTTLQLIKVTVNLEGPFPIEANYLFVMISFPDTDQVNATFVTAFPPGGFYEQECHWRKRPVIGRTYTFFVLLKVDKLVEGQVQYKPRVEVGIGEIIESVNVEGNTVTLFHPEGVTGIFSTGNYVEWEGYTARMIMMRLNLISTAPT